MTTTDPYARITELDTVTVEALAQRIATRAADVRQHRLWQEFLARVDHDNARVLEVGCGTGVITELIAARPGVIEAVGVDPSEGLIAHARRRAPSLHFDVADGRRLPYPDAAFDGVVFATTLCHVPHPELALREAHRVLRPRGSLLVYDGDYVTTTVALAAQDPLQRCVDAAIAAIVHDPRLVRRLPRLVEQAGFEAGDLRSHGHIEVDQPSYLISMIDFGADQLSAAGDIAVETAAALRQEARSRAANGRFFGHISYASLPAVRVP